MSLAVVIPIYKHSLTDYERICFERCSSILDCYPIIFVAPDGLDLQQYDSEKIADIYRFDAKFFKSISTYSQLLLSPFFYKRFCPYQHILIAQLDAFIFGGDLSQWLEYDYVGAPWLDGLTVTRFMFHGAGPLTKWLPFLYPHQRCYVGNGGLSLRNVSATLSLLSRYAFQIKTWNQAEDIFFSYYGLKDDNFRLPALKVALAFAFEQEPRRCFEMNDRKLPFGCHAWEKWDREFWRSIFRNYGVEL